MFRAVAAELAGLRMLYFLHECFPDFDLFFDSAVIYIFNTFPYIFHSFFSGSLSTYPTR